MYETLACVFADINLKQSVLSNWHNSLQINVKKRSIIIDIAAHHKYVHLRLLRRYYWFLFAQDLLFQINTTDCGYNWIAASWKGLLFLDTLYNCLKFFSLHIIVHKTSAQNFTMLGRKTKIYHVWYLWNWLSYGFLWRLTQILRAWMCAWFIVLYTILST